MRHRHGRLVAAVLIAGTVLVARVHAATTWPPFDPSVLSDTTSHVEPGADAEILLWTIQSTQNEYDDGATTIEEHFIRTKVYTARGVSEHGTVSFPMLEDAKITGLAARTIAPDGTIREVTPREIHEETLLRAGGLRIRNRSFVFPGATPGSVLDLTYRVTILQGSFRNVQFVPAQIGVPIRRLELEFVPPPGQKFIAWRTSSAGTMTDLVEPQPGHFRTVLTDLPAYHTEPDIVSDFACRVWVLGEVPPYDGEMSTYWEDVARYFRGSLQHYAEAPDGLRRTALEVAAGATTPEEKFRRLDQYLRAHVRNVFALPDSESSIQRSFKPNERPWDALRKGLGSAYDIDMLLFLMASRIGLEPKLAYSTGRWNAFFDRGRLTHGMLTSFRVALRTDHGWWFTDPGNADRPPGWLPADQEGQDVLMANVVDSLFVRAPCAPPDSSRRDRIAHVRIDAGGDAEVDVRETATGHVALAWIGDADFARTADSLQVALRPRWPECTVSDAHVEHVAGGPLRVERSYRVHVPHYASSAGKRWLVPAFWFARGFGREFPEPRRRFPIAIDFAWCGTDSVVIEAPAGQAFEFTAPGSPIAFPWGREEASIATSDEGRSLVAVRSVRTGDAPTRVYPAFVYPAVRDADERRAQWNDAVAVMRASAPGKP